MQRYLTYLRVLAPPRQRIIEVKVVNLTFLSLMTRFFLVYVSMYNVMVQFGQFDLFVIDDAILFGVCKYVQRNGTIWSI